MSEDLLNKKLSNNHQEVTANNKDAVESDDTDLSPDEHKEDNKTPEPTFANEPRYDPPDTPKKTPSKPEPNPMLRLAVPRSARGRKISFKDDDRAKETKKGKDESDLSDDEADQDEILSLDVESKTFTQEIKETHAVVTCKSTNITTMADTYNTNNNNPCREIVPLLHNSRKSSVSSTDLVPVETVEIKPLTLSKYPPSWSTSITPASRISVSTAGTNSSNNSSGFN